MRLGITAGGFDQEAKADERLLDVINCSGSKVPQAGYHPQLGPTQACDTCMVEVDGCLAGTCATTGSAGMSVRTNYAAGGDAQRAAFDPFLGNHLLSRTVCSCNALIEASMLGVQADAEEAKPPGLFKLIGTFWKKDFRRGSAAFNDLPVVFGRNLTEKNLPH